jgi:hypothetical protein
MPRPVAGIPKRVAQMQKVMQMRERLAPDLANELREQRFAATQSEEPLRPGARLSGDRETISSHPTLPAARRPPLLQRPELTSCAWAARVNASRLRNRRHGLHACRWGRAGLLRGGCRFCPSLQIGNCWTFGRVGTQTTLHRIRECRRQIRGQGRGLGSSIEPRWQILSECLYQGYAERPDICGGGHFAAFRFGRVVHGKPGALFPGNSHGADSVARQLQLIVDDKKV